MSRGRAERDRVVRHVTRSSPQVCGQRTPPWTRPDTEAPSYEILLVALASAVFVIAIGGTFGVALLGLWLGSR